MTYEVLTEEQAQDFLKNGYVIINGCFSREFAQDWTNKAFIRLGYDPDDPDSWEEPLIHMPGLHHVQLKEFSPKVWGAICDLVGGEDRIKNPNDVYWADGFIANFHRGADRPWQPPSAEVGGWHKDGDFFKHFLDSPEQGLLTIVIWSDIEPHGGGTFVAEDSVKPVAEHLLAHPEGVDGGFGQLIDQCERFTEVTGKIGDVALIHPYVLHASSQNVSRRARFITNPPISLAEPMEFNRENPDDFSLVEKSVLQALGVDRLDFQPTAERETFKSRSSYKKDTMIEEHKARLAAHMEQNP